MRRGLAAGLCLVVFAGGIAAAEPTPDWLKAQIAARGAKAVVDRLWREHCWDAVAMHIDSGRAEWIGLAPLLAPGTDAGTAEELGIALAFALPKNPRAVLAVLADRHMPLSPEVVCGAPFIEDTVKDVPAYLRRATAAVARVGDARLVRAKAACLAELAKAARRPTR